MISLLGTLMPSPLSSLNPLRLTTVKLISVTPFFLFPFSPLFSFFFLFYLLAFRRQPSPDVVLMLLNQIERTRAVSRSPAFRSMGRARTSRQFVRAERVVFEKRVERVEKSVR